MKLALVLLPLTACVVNRESRATQAEAARGVQAPSLAERPRTVASGATPVEPIPPERKNAEWVAGYWHWDGVRYVWEPGKFEPRK